MFEEAKNEILQAIRSFESIVDAHEHLAPERDRVAMQPDVCFLFSHYLTGSLHAAGFDLGDGRVLSRGQVREFLLDASRPVEERFSVLERFIPAVRETSYAQAMWRALQDLYGFDDITRENFMAITEAMRQANTPGIYDRILSDKCRIRFALTQQGRTDYTEPYMVPVLHLSMLHSFPEGKETLIRRSEKLGLNVQSLDDYLDLCRLQLVQWRDRERVVGMKTHSQPYVPPPDRDEASVLFDRLLRSGSFDAGENAALERYLREELIAMCGELDLTVAVHAGVWDDFRQLDPRHNIPLIVKYPQTRFDIYHMGMPWVRDTLFLAGNWHNVYINWCWAHIVSFYMAQTSIREYVDFVPVNKIMAFGGDYSAPAVEKVYGHLTMAQENVAAALAWMVTDRRMTTDRAIEVARMWFWDNPVRIYGLDRFL
ncbi:MAG: amidohydrolase family protein [Armatimonadetes bacterium]|nr:amidohydrolase family protein [Armatimonadota bacterium]